MTKLSVVPDKNVRSLAPKHLRPATRRWFDEILASFELESQHVKILQIAAEAWDTYEQARDVIAEQGFTFVNKKHGDIKPRPEVAIMQNSRIAFLRALRELNLDVTPPDTPRPSPLKYPRGSERI
jgi:phage terminase small subunit